MLPWLAQIKIASCERPGKTLRKFDRATQTRTPMTAKDFRRIALSMPEATENSHMDHPDFRVAGKIFATLGYPDETCGMVKLPPEKQKSFSQDFPDAFTPVKGGWGRNGATQVHLKNVDKLTLRRAITAAYQNVAVKPLPRKKA
jgi:hypothetical protein